MIKYKRVFIMCMKKIAEIKERHLEKNLDNVVSVANELLKELNINKAPVDISRILNGLGFKIFVVDGLDENISGLILINPDIIKNYGTDRIIILNSNDESGRQRFTLAHEFSHYIFDFNEETESVYIDAYDTDRDNDSSEIISSRFAAEFLIPKTLFIKKYKELRNDSNNHYNHVLELMKYFNVSRKSIETRFEELKDALN